VRVVVVGAGVAGLAAGRRLTEAGHEVVLLDKGRTPGGRLATRRVAGAVLDHGAQFLTVRSEPFAALLQPLVADGLVVEWCRGFAAPDGHPRYAVRGGMNALAKRMALGLDVRSGRLVFAVRPGPAGTSGAWEVVLDDASALAADAVVLTSPMPQSSSLLLPAGLDVPEAVRWLSYWPTLALLVVLDGPGGVPDPGGVQDPDETFSFIGDNAAKGISTVPALTFHVRPARSRERWDEPAPLVHADLLVAAEPWLGGAHVVESQLKRWRFAVPETPWPERCVVLGGERGPVVLAGDAFGGPKVEGAYLSGLAAADAVLAD